MNLRFARLMLLFLFLAPIPGQLAAQIPSPEKSVVEIAVSSQTVEPSLPWQRNPPVAQTGFGVVVASNRFLVPADLVNHAVMVEIRPARDARKFPARIIRVDPQAGAALLECRDARDAADFRPLPLFHSVRSTGEVALVQFNSQGDIQTDRGQILAAAVQALPDAGSALLMMRVLTSLNAGGRGAPVFIDNRLAGIVLRFERGSQTAQVLPIVALDRFLDPAPYPGVASAGLLWEPLVDPVRRRFRGIEVPDRGVEILDTLPGSGAAETLISGDVLLSLGGFPIDDQGYYPDPDLGRLLFPHLISGHHKPGDSIAAQIVRQGQTTNLLIRLARRDDRKNLIPENQTLSRPDYIVESGFIFRELGGDYLRQYGGQWRAKANPRFVHLYLTHAQDRSVENDKVVILVGILPDLVNIGYQHLRDGIVLSANGKPIHRLADLARQIQNDGGLRRVRINNLEQDLVLDSDHRVEANRRIAQTYRIPRLLSIESVAGDDPQ
jgi:S1-C subfamily serine protease